VRATADVKVARVAVAFTMCMSYPIFTFLARHAILDALGLSAERKVLVACGLCCYYVRLTVIAIP
jgi:hypothetical protein